MEGDKRPPVAHLLQILAPPQEVLNVRKTPTTRKKPYNQNKAIKKPKYDDLQRILPYLKPQNRSFYQNLRLGGNDEVTASQTTRKSKNTDVRPFGFDDSWLTAA